MRLLKCYIKIIVLKEKLIYIKFLFENYLNMENFVEKI